MTTATAAIANHLNVAASAIVEVQEWARVLWVRIKGVGARFVSKKVIAVKEDWIKVEVSCEAVVAERNSKRAFVLRPGYDMGNAYLVKEIPLSTMQQKGFAPRMVHYDRIPSTGKAVTVPAIIDSITASTIEERALQALHCAPCW
jgi:hypothetical protein